jgi:hypothetical protein
MNPYLNPSLLLNALLALLALLELRTDLSQ